MVCAYVDVCACVYASEHADEDTHAEASSVLVHMETETEIQTDADTDTDEGGDTDSQTMTARLKCGSVARVGLFFFWTFSCGNQ